MKKQPCNSSKRVRRAACTVSAAALMLGVSHAATVGFNFETTYCYDSRYSGFPVTMTAFGVATNGWENLSPMLTAYGCTNNSVPYTLNEVIDTTTSTGGLNPLPHGSLSVTWSADGANFSGFGGYAVNTPSHGFDGAPPVPQPSGEMQIYSSFLRDGVNFGVNPGTGVGGADNNAPGYSVNITGLKTLFTNTPFVIQLIASSDSMQKLTNAFIIDATAGVTNSSVAYTNTPFPTDEGGTGGQWIRGHGGGLSTVSGTLNTDHVQIMGNRAAHGSAGGPGGFDNASTIAGFIVTDKPVVTMSPQPVLAGPGDNVTLRAIAIGVPPLSLQWRKGGAPIPGATNLSYVTTNITAGGNFDLVVTNLYGSTTSAVASVTIDPLSIARGPNFTLDSKPAGNPHDGAVLGATFLASSTDGNGTNRTGVTQFSALDPDQIAVPVSDTSLDSAQGTIMFWMRSAGTITTNGGNEGAMLFDRRSLVLQTGTGIVLVQRDSGGVWAQAQQGNVDITTSIDVSDNNWHHIAVTFDTAVGVQFYVDGVSDTFGPTTAAWSMPAGQEVELGLSHDSHWRAYDGLLDDVRVYNRQLTAGEIASVHTSNALVDTNALQMQLDFNASPVPGVTANWLSGADILQSAGSVLGPYSDVPFATAPYRAKIQPGQQYYRYRHVPVPINSNPFDM